MRRMNASRVAAIFTGFIEPTAMDWAAERSVVISSENASGNSGCTGGEAPSRLTPGGRLPPSATRDMLGPMSQPLELTRSASATEPRERHAFAFVAERLWLDFVNSDRVARGDDALSDFDRFVRWLEAAHLLDEERAAAMLRRSQQQPPPPLPLLRDARRVRNGLLALAERGAPPSTIASA